MKKKLAVLLSVLMLFTMAFSSPLTAYAATNPGYSVKFGKSKTKDKKTSFPLTIYNQSASRALIKFQLRDKSGKVVATWKDVELSSGNSLNQNPWCYLNKYPAGYYNFYVYMRNAWDDSSTWWNWKKKIYNNTGGVTFRQPSLRKLKNGKMIPRISVNCKNIKGKYLFLEIFDEYGNKIYKKKSSKPLQGTNSVFHFNWSGKSGGSQYSSGYYHVRVGFSGGKWTETDMYLDFSKAY